MNEQKPDAHAKTSKRERLQSLLARDPNVLACPVCGAALRLSREASALCCARGHCHDIAKKGYVNLLGRGGGAKGVYDAAFFANRRAAFGFGLYEEAARRIAALAKELLRPAETGGQIERAGAIRALDAGCGEGYFAFALSRDASPGAVCRFYGLDLSREAIAMATDYEADIAWIVGDLAKPPFRDGAFDLVLNVLSPASYGAFRRILARDGVLIKVLPGPDHLRELRALRGELEGGRSGEGAREHVERHMRVAERASVRYFRALRPEQKKVLPAMTPLTAGKTPDPVALDSLRRVTVDLEIVAGRPL
ncbi:MAG: methyltransferase domain-containing protein [Clostridiales Family XIII bacterium]|jgi:23S rRNA (guanine745-N1)-methyltransferase|nr:methyltransferase domain-containing protein [Clostridiales Family XIII bacterium]